MRTSGANKRSGGFTLVELLVVLVIIVAATAVVIPSITGTDSNVFSAQVRQAVSMLNYARRIAIVDSSPMIAVFFAMDPEDPEYETVRNELNVKTNSFWESAELHIYFDDDLTGLREEKDFYEITFFPEGGSTGGTITFELDEMSASIRVDPITGRISTRYFDEEFGDES